MRCEQISTRLADSLAATLGKNEREELEEHLQTCAACREELAGLSGLWQRLGKVSADEPDSSAMRERFDAMLADHARGIGYSQDDERDRAAPAAPLASASQAALPSVDALALRAEHRLPPSQAQEALSPRNRPSLRPRRRRAFHPFLQACAAVLLVVAGIQVGRQLASSPATSVLSSPDVTALRAEVRDLRQMVTLSLMQQQSASERLKGVSWSNQLDRPGNEVVSALIDTLMHDTNVNVRLASIDALKRFAERDVVRAATIRALDTQTSPLVQMALIDFVVETREREALESLRRLARDEQTNEVVRSRATWGIGHLEAA